MKSILELARPTRYLSMNGLDEFSRKLLFKKLNLLEEGRLEVTDPEGNQVFFGNRNGPQASVHIHQSRAFSRIVLGGSIGTGESYVDGDWDTRDLVSLVRLFVRNRTVLNSLDSGLGALFHPFQKFLHRFRENNETQARTNIQAHYDLGNGFFELFLDESWMYSSGFYPKFDSTLTEAQFEKNDRICRNLELKPSHQLIEIGTGWGGFAIHAAKHFGCQVTTTTISDAQFLHAQARIKAEGLENQITLLNQDYRSLNGTYDRLVSIEMIEAVGDSFLESYFKKCSSLLKPEGKMALQSILIQDQFYAQALKNVDFIQTHIFPGSTIPSVSRICDSIRDTTDMKLVRFEDFGMDYARTLREWSNRLHKNKEKISALGYPAYLYRLWQFYFSYCEGGFLEGQIGVAHFIFSKPKALKPFSDVI